MRTRLRNNERGAALLETAITIPIILLICVGIFEFGRAYQTWQVLTNAAREGARIAVLPNSQDSAIRNRVVTYMQTGQLPEATNATIDIDHNTSIDIGSGSATGSQVSIQY